MTQKVLLINFKRIGDLISSMMAQGDFENKEIHVLCYREISPVEKSIRDDIHFHYINRHQIEFLLKSPLFNDAHAVNELHNSLQELKETQWDEIVNFSNDQLASRVIPILKNPNTRISGIHYKNNSLQHAGTWEIIYNNILSTSKVNPVNLKDVFKYMVGNEETHRTDGTSFLKKSSKHLEMVRKNFDLLREKYSEFGVSAQVIGVAPFASTLTKSISVDVTIELINKIKDGKRKQIPVLIYAPIETEKLKVDQISKHFNGNLVTIEADLLALNAVLTNIDFLVTADTATIHYANEIGTTSIMVANGEAPLFRQGTANAGDLVITNINLDKNLENLDQVNAEDIYRSLEILSSPEKNINLNEFKSRLYLVNQDDFGSYFMQLTAQKDFHLLELKRDLTRNYFARTMCNKKMNIQVPPAILELKAAEAYLEAEKLNVFRITKNVLTCLRLAKATSPEGQKQFIETLNEIITNIDHEKSVTSIPVAIFYQEINQAEFPNKDEHLKFFERKLFRLKNDLQVLFNLFKEYHAFLVAQKAKVAQKSIRSTEANL